MDLRLKRRRLLPTLRQPRPDRSLNLTYLRLLNVVLFTLRMVYGVMTMSVSND